MLFRSVTSMAVASAMFSSAQAGLLDILNPILDPLTSGAPADNVAGIDLGLGLLTNGVLVNLDAFAGVLSGSSCSNPDQTIGLGINLPPLIRACVCVDILNNQGGTNPNACPACPANADRICGDGKCACACNAGFYADPRGECLPIAGCQDPAGTLVDNGDGTSTCTCSPGYTKVNGVCTSGASQVVGRMSRKMKKNIIPAHPHAARSSHQQIVVKAAAAPAVVGDEEKPSCPTGEVACPLPKGGFECIDTESSLTSCGGCVGGSSSKGVNCLSIPGALGVECHVGKCAVSSCFRGWSYKAGKCV